MSEKNLLEQIDEDILKALTEIAEKYEVNKKAIVIKAISSDIADVFHTWSAQWVSDE